MQRLKAARRINKCKGTLDWGILIYEINRLMNELVPLRVRFHRFLSLTLRLGVILLVEADLWTSGGFVAEVRNHYNYNAAFFFRWEIIENWGGDKKQVPTLVNMQMLSLSRGRSF
jgi:hypothetical protein